jgi:hypothetical protein
MVILEKKSTNIPRSHSLVQCRRQDWRENLRGLMQMIVLCADVVVAELKGAVAVFKEAVLEVAEVDVVVVVLPCRWSCGRTRGARMMTETRRARQSSWEEAMPKATQSRPSWT